MSETTGATSVRVAPGTSLAEAVRLLSQSFRAFSEDHGLEARVLVCESAGVDHARLIVDGGRALGADAADLINARAARRMAREPLSRILGRRGFWSLMLRVAPDVLDPRPDTETVVEAALAMTRERRDAPLRILDIGVGSGAILCALLSELPRAEGVGLDISSAACATTRDNCAALGLGRRAVIVEGDAAAGVSGRFDIAVSNPPYVASATIDALAPEVRAHDPRVALDGGPDGLDFYRKLARRLPDLLAPGGVAVLEVGFDQASSVESMLAAAGLRPAGRWKDAGGHDRALAFTALMPENA